MEYDSEARRVGLRAVVGAAYFAAYDDIHNDWDVDRAGNLYYLDFKADRVDVMMVPCFIIAQAIRYNQETFLHRLALRCRSEQTKNSQTPGKHLSTIDKAIIDRV